MYCKAAKILLLLLFTGVYVRAQDTPLQIADARFDTYLPLLQNKRVALVVNQTSMIGRVHLVDTLLGMKIKVVKVFAPEHGFRGNLANGATVQNDTDTKTHLPIISLYGDTKKPKKSDLKDVDVVVFDIQDVGVRFYTYISTLHYVMEACGEQNKTLVVLDRPNPNAYFIDGPMLEKKFSSFVGVDPVPLVYGMTIGEYAQMVNGEKWIAKPCDLKVITMEGYNHAYRYDLPIPPSPNLPNMDAVYLYPSLGLFEGTDVSVGRGTDLAFQVIGRPGFSQGNYTFIPKSIPGKADNPPYRGMECKGYKIGHFAEEHIRPSQQLYLYWLEGFYKASLNKDNFFTPYFDKLAGTDKLRKAFVEGKTIDQIRASWQPDLEKFKKVREKYLLYQ
jgi:uncharacterized protein YbbC (DUF1343 family)